MTHTRRMGNKAGGLSLQPRNPLMGRLLLPQTKRALHAKRTFPPPQFRPRTSPLLLLHQTSVPRGL